jgi:hypothetical protein
LFYKLFQGVPRRTADSKQLGQAIVLITQHGYEAAKFIIEFSVSAAQQTNYHPQTLGGVMQYVSRALAAFHQPKAVALQEPVAVERAKNEHQAPDTNGVLAGLDPNDYQARYGRAKDRVLQNPFIARHYKPESAVIESMIRNEMVKVLQAEQPQPDENGAAGAQAHGQSVLEASTPDQSSSAELRSNIAEADALEETPAGDVDFGTAIIIPSGSLSENLALPLSETGQVGIDAHPGKNAAPSGI